jgi:hypothetical protein
VNALNAHNSAPAASSATGFTPDILRDLVSFIDSPLLCFTRPAE